MNYDFTEVDSAELRAMRQELDAELTARSESDRARIAEQIQEMAASVGLTVEQVLSGAKPNGNGGNGKVKRPAKYRNPVNPNETWSGRGKRPVWFRDQLATGHSADEFLITA